VLRSLLLQTVETPECMWDGRMAAQAAAEVASLAAAVRQQHAGGSFDWSPPTGYQLEFDSLRGEVYVGGVYVRLFLKNPKYAVRDPVKFAEALVERYLQELTAAAAAANTGAATAAASLDQCLLLSAAAVALLQGHGLLADHVAQLGCSGRLLTNLAARTARIPAPPPDQQQQPQQQPQQQRVPPDELGGSILRLLHQLAASTGAAEAMAASTSAPVVPTLLPAMAWGHGASILVLETLKRALSPANRQRDSLVAQALQAGLVQKLLLLLDWRSGEAAAAADSAGASGSGMTQAQEQELAVERTLAVDVLRLLADEGSYSAQVNSVLGQSPVWAAYRDQRHDMFLPSGATAETGVVGLLTAGDTARFALPAPESVQGTANAGTGPVPGTGAPGAL
jgi:DnaJ family protein C protein 13